MYVKVLWHFLHQTSSGETGGRSRKGRRANLIDIS